MFIALWDTLGLLTDYVNILLITDGGPGKASEVWALSAYHKAFIDGKYGYGAAISLILILVVLVLMIAISIVNARMEGGIWMFSPKRDETRPGYEMRKEHIAIGVMILLCLPILAIYVTFFAQAFVADGKLSLSNFRFLYTTIVLGQYTVPTMGPAFRNTVIFTLCVTACEVVVSLMAGYALSRMRFTGRNFLQKLLLILRLFPGVLLLISICMY